MKSGQVNNLNIILKQGLSKSSVLVLYYVFDERNTPKICVSFFEHLHRQISKKFEVNIKILDVKQKRKLKRYKFPKCMLDSFDFLRITFRNWFRFKLFEYVIFYIAFLISKNGNGKILEKFPNGHLDLRLNTC